MRGSCRASTLHCLLSNTKLHAFRGGTAALLSVTRSHSCNHFTEAMVCIIWLIFKIYWHQSPSSLFSPFFLSFPFSPFPAKHSRNLQVKLHGLGRCRALALPEAESSSLSSVPCLSCAANEMAFDVSVRSVRSVKSSNGNRKKLSSRVNLGDMLLLHNSIFLFGESCQNQSPFQLTKVNFWNIGAKMC